MIRPSSLTLAERCELAPVLGDEFPETNANIERGNLVDLQVSRQLLGGAAATDPDALAILQWMHDQHFNGVEARGFAQELVELMDPDSFEVLTRGTPDYAHVSASPGGVITIVDYKKREQYAAGRLADPDDNLQLHAYALAWALAARARAYRMVILLFGEGQVEPIWSSKVYTPGDWLPFLDRIRAVQGKKRERVANGAGRPRPTAGPHCAQCYHRLHCPSWMYPAAEGATALAPMSTPGGITKDNAGALLLYVLSVKEAAERAQELLKAFAQDNGGAIEVGDRKWAPITIAGRKTGPSVADLEQAGLHHLIKVAKPYQQWRMSKR